eukprot:scaffold767_cov385-Pavlova_lutheri.AAC.1
MQRLTSYKVLTTTKGSRTPAPSSPRGSCFVMCTWVAPLRKIPSHLYRSLEGLALRGPIHGP